jgi:hypothetical protein
MDLDSTNGTFINVSVLVICVNLVRLRSCSECALFMQENRIEPCRYYELFGKDTIKFGNSRHDHNH